MNDDEELRVENERPNEDNGQLRHAARSPRSLLIPAATYSCEVGLLEKQLANTRGIAEEPHTHELVSAELLKNRDKT